MRDKLTKEERVIELLYDGRWHSGRELALKVSHRFGGYLFTLKKQGFVWEKRRDPAAPKGESWWQYRLVHIPGFGSDPHGQTHMEVE